MIFNTMRRLAKKAFSSKTYVLAVINRFVPESLGKVTDLEIDRESKNIALKLLRGDEDASLHVKKYGIRYRGSRSYLIFETIFAQGFLRPQLKSAMKNREIEIEKRYIKAVKTLIRA
jgi:sporulation protein YlmC with PRC-barrel domain